MCSVALHGRWVARAWVLTQPGLQSLILSLYFHRDRLKVLSLYFIFVPHHQLFLKRILSARSPSSARCFCAPRSQKCRFLSPPPHLPPSARKTIIFSITSFECSMHLQTCLGKALTAERCPEAEAGVTSALQRMPELSLCMCLQQWKVRSVRWRHR